MAKVKDRAKKEEAQLEEASAGVESSLKDFLGNNQKLLTTVMIIVGVVVVGLGYYFTSVQSQNTEANREMFQAVYEFEGDSLDKALNGVGSFLGLESVAEDYSGTGAGNMARYYTGIAYLEKGELEIGIDYLEGVSTGNDVLSMATYIALGFAYEDLGDPAKAAGMFEKAASTPDENDATTPDMLFHAGRNYEAAGNNSKALSIYKRIKEDYPLSSKGQTIDKYIGRVTE